MLLLRKNTATHPLQLRQRAGGYKAIAKEEEDEDEEEEDEDEEDTGDEDEDADENEDSDQGDEETSCGAAGEKKGVGDGKSAADVLIVGEEKAQHHKEDGKRASEGVNDAPAATKAKTTTLSTEQQSSELNYFALVLSLCCSTGVRVGAFGSESTLYMVYFIYGNGNIGGWNPLWKIIGGNLNGL